MVVERSRRWVKERMPAFICRETNWWVSRWIQTNILLCPHCRQEYRSLKQVWDHLDAWDCEEPSPQCPTEFSSKLREQFPSAFSAESPTPKRRFFELGFGKVAFAGGTLAVAVACVLLLPIDTTSSRTGSPAVVEAPQNPAPAEIPEPTRIASALPADPTEDSAPTRNPDFAEMDPIPRSEWNSTANRMVRPVSFGNSTVQEPRSSRRILTRHTMEINSHPVTGFTALSYSTEEQAY